eukprot:scaffold62517_cov66-Phaeocystis_antarctica.AAC.2
MPRVPPASCHSARRPPPPAITRGLSAPSLYVSANDAPPPSTSAHTAPGSRDRKLLPIPAISLVASRCETPAAHPLTGESRVMPKKLTNIIGCPEIQVNGKKAHYHGVPNDVKARWIDGPLYTHLKFSVQYQSSSNTVVANSQGLFGNEPGPLGHDDLKNAEIAFKKEIQNSLLKLFVQ